MSAPTSPIIAVLIPAHDEAERIQSTVRAALSIPGVSRVIVIDDGSHDDTSRQAEDAGAKVIRLLHNVGKGAALETGAKRAEDADIILLLDGDLGSTASQGELLLEPLLNKSADMAIAGFPRPAGKAGFGLVKSLARNYIATVANGWVPEAPLSGQRAITRACLDDIRPFASGYGVELALTVRALRKGYRLTEVPTTMTHAATGRDLKGFIHRGRQYYHVWLAINKLKREA